MTSGRLPPAPLDAAVAAERAAGVGLPAWVADLNIFRCLLHAPGVAAAVHGLLDQLLFRARLDHRLRELMIMRLAWRTASVYEWTQHWSIARGFGVTDGELEALRRPDPGLTDPAAAAVVAAVDDVVDTGAIRPATWERIAAAGTDPAVAVEVAATVATWRMVGHLIDSLGVTLEPGTAPWPPDGVGPAAAGAAGPGEGGDRSGRGGPR